MTILKSLGVKDPESHHNAATRVDKRMSEEERERELARLREENLKGPSEEDKERYQRKLERLKARGIPLRLVNKADWEQRKARITQRHMVA